MKSEEVLCAFGTFLISRLRRHLTYSLLAITYYLLLKAVLVRQKGLEPPTYCLEGSCSIQLSYWRISSGAGDGNRTRVSSLEGWCSTIELHPQVHDGFSHKILA